MARIKVDRQYLDSMRSYLEHLESGGSDLLVSPPSSDSGFSQMMVYLFSDPDYIDIALYGCLAAWSSGLFVGIVLKYINKLKA